MKKFFFVLGLILLISEKSFAESYYFNDCKLSNAVIGNYIINLEKQTIEVELKSIDGKIQYFSDKIKLIEKNKIVSEKIKSAKGDDFYYQYFLNSDSKTVTKLEYKKEVGIDMEVYNLSGKRKSLCANIKTGWDKLKIDQAEISKEQEQVLKEQEKLKNEQSALVECQGNDLKKWTNCKGAYKADTGHKYEGLFIGGKIFKGLSVYPGGGKYVGEFKNFLPNGFGTFLWKNGDKYYGEWKNGKSHGNGTKTWTDGRKYSGQFKNDKLDGEGTFFYPDGKKYVGDFLNGKRHGEGVFSYSDGTAYIGKFIAGKEEGEGECVAKDGSVKKCKSKIDTQAQDFSGKDTLNISVVSKKWVRISQYESNTKRGKKIMDKLKADFELKAKELCLPKSNYNVLEKKIEVLDLDETPAYGLETKVKLGANGVVECI